MAIPRASESSIVWLLRGSLSLFLVSNGRTLELGRNLNELESTCFRGMQLKIQTYRHSTLARVMAFLTASRVITRGRTSGTDRAHITWLEHMLITRARRAGRSHLNNGNTPAEPTLSEADKADTHLFLREILQVLPLVGLRAFEIPVPVATPNASGGVTPTAPKMSDEPDTVIVPAQKDGFDDVFLGQNAWWAIRIGGGMIPKIKYIAAYQSNPISAVTHVAPVASIEPYGEDGKYKLIFSEPARPIGPIPFADAPSGSMQGPRYTTYARLMVAKKVADLFPK